MKNCEMIITNDFLKRPYYENDNSFFSRGINLTCLDFARREGLRGYDVDENIVFCEDINIALSIQPEKTYCRKNHLRYNKQACKYVQITEDAGAAEKIIKQLIDSKKIVVFRTALDYLKIFAGYHPEEPHTYTSHYAIIVGYDDENYFMVDAPGMRNSKHFIAHPNNPAIGCTNKDELHQAFQIYCEIGCIDVDLKYLVGLDRILKGIIKNFYYVKTTKDTFYVGKEALEILAEMLNNNLDTSMFDWYDLEVLASRFAILKLNLEKYPYLEGLDQCIILLEKLRDTWRVFKNVLIKSLYTSQDDIGKRAANIIVSEIIPETEQLMQFLKKYIDKVAEK